MLTALLKIGDNRFSVLVTCNIFTSVNKYIKSNSAKHICESNTFSSASEGRGIRLFCGWFLLISKADFHRTLDSRLDYFVSTSFAFYFAVCWLSEARVFQPVRRKGRSYMNADWFYHPFLVL